MTMPTKDRHHPPGTYEAVLEDLWQPLIQSGRCLHPVTMGHDRKGDIIERACLARADSGSIVPFCEQHLREYLWLHAHCSDREAHEKKSLPKIRETLKEQIERHHLRDLKSVVYYLRRPSDEAIKIGVSSQLANRIRNLAKLEGEDLELLAYEQGSYDVENDRHRLYGQYALGGEWFRPGEKLLAHIGRLREDGLLPLDPWHLLYYPGEWFPSPLRIRV